MIPQVFETRKNIIYLSSTRKPPPFTTMADEWEKTGRVNFKGLTNSLFDAPKQTQVRNLDTGELRWVDGEIGDDDDDLGRRIADGEWVEDEAEIDDDETEEE